MSNHITAETTDESIIAQIAYAKTRLQEGAAEAAATEHFMGEHLVSLAQNVYSAETLANAQMGYRNVCQNAPENRVFFLADLAAKGADDRWSGRNNDSNRAAHDAIIGWARDEIAALRREAR